MLTSLVYMQQRGVKKPGNFIKIVNIDEENLHISWTTRGMSKKFSGKMYLMVILKVTKNTVLEKPQVGWWGGGVTLIPYSLFRVTEANSKNIGH